MAAAGLAWMMISAGLAAHAPLRQGAPTVAGARAAVARDPLDEAALRDLGLALDAASQGAAADAVMDVAATRTARDTSLSAWVLHRRLQQGRPAEAFGAADALMRRDIGPELRDRLSALLITAASDPAARPALVERLATRPSWREAFIEEMAIAGEPAAARAVLSALTAAGAAPGPTEYGPYLARLVAAKQYARALDDWCLFTGRRAGRAGPNLDPEDGAPFTFSRAEGNGASSEIRPAFGGALRVAYDGFSTPDLPRQMLVLAPGRYRLSGLARLESGAAGGRLAWTVACADTGARLAGSGPMAADPEWRAWELAIDVPATDCAAQWLALTAEPGARPRPATTWYAKLALKPE